jgi:hypothetical protein
MKSHWEVIVGNIGTVYSGGSALEAKRKFTTYVKQSKSGVGRAGGEDVTLMRDGEPVREHYGIQTNPAPKGWLKVSAVRIRRAKGKVIVETRR